MLQYTSGLGVNLPDGLVIPCFCVAYYYLTHSFVLFGVNVPFNIIDFQMRVKCIFLQKVLDKCE